MKLILASGSPRRAEILRNAGFVFEVRPAAAEESRLPGETANQYVLRLAEAKAAAIARMAAGAQENAIVMGADTTVVVDDAVLEKPADDNGARRMLRLLSGRAHEVLTGVALVRAPAGKQMSERMSFVESTRVTFLPLSGEQIEAYIATREPFDKAGGYGIQGIGGRFVSRIEGCYFNVMGLPLSRLWQALQAMGWDEGGEKSSQK